MTINEMVEANDDGLNETISLLLRHRSIRKFTQQDVTRQQIEQIVAAGQAASTSSNVQAYTVIAVTEEARKAELARLAGNQDYVRECPVFLVWCADMSRLKKAAELHLPGTPTYEGTVENLLVSTIDVALAAQNAAIAAESMGLGVVYIGGIRNHIAEVTELLRLPRLSYPVFGMCIGYPDQQPLKRPRLPQGAVLHWNEYDDANSDQHLTRYDEIMSDYLRERSNGAKDTPWTVLMAEKLAQPARLHLRSFLAQQGFEMK